MFPTGHLKVSFRLSFCSGLVDLGRNRELTSGYDMPRSAS